MLTPPYTPVSAAPSASSIQHGDLEEPSLDMKPRSIFDAATLVAYNIPIDRPDSTVETILHLIDLAKKRESSIAYDFKIHHDPYTPNRHDKRVARISLLDEVHQQDHEAWKQVDKLRLALLQQADEKKSGMEVEWSACEANDRAQSCSYVISGKLNDARFKDDDKRFRLHILNMALRKLELQTSSHLWQEHGHPGVGGRGFYGHVQLASPGQVASAIATGACSVTLDDSATFDIKFEPIPYHIQPTSCSTIAAELRNDEPDMSDLESSVNDLEEWVQGVWPEANYSVIGVIDGWLHVDASSPMVAHAFCERPIFDGHFQIFFRQVYFVNGNPFNFKKGGGTNYRTKRQSDYDGRKGDSRSYKFEPTGSTMEFVVDHRKIRGHDDPMSNLQMRISQSEKDARKKKLILTTEMRRRGFRPDDEWNRIKDQLKLLEEGIKESKAELEGLKREEEAEAERLTLMRTESAAKQEKAKRAAFRVQLKVASSEDHLATDAVAANESKTIPITPDAASVTFTVHQTGTGTNTGPTTETHSSSSVPAVAAAVTVTNLAPLSPKLDRKRSSSVFGTEEDHIAKKAKLDPFALTIPIADAGFGVVDAGVVAARVGIDDSAGPISGIDITAPRSSDSNPSEMFGRSMVPKLRVSGTPVSGQSGFPVTTTTTEETLIVEESE